MNNIIKANSTNGAVISIDNQATNTQLSPPEYIWNYVASTVGGQTTLPPIWWFVTVALLAAILYCYQKKPQTLSISNKGLSIPILITFINHLINNFVFIVSTYVVNYIVNYNRAVLDASNWLNTWFTYF